MSGRIWIPARTTVRGFGQPAATWNGPYLQWNNWRQPVAPGMQAARVSVPMRQATCEEVGCTWYMFGHEGEDPDQNGVMAPFVHPAGVRCGDFKRCWHPNCPCPARARQHRIPDERYQLLHRVNTAQGARVVTNDEWKYRVAEGLDAQVHIKTRGL